MTIEQDGLKPRKQREFAIPVSPACLNDPHPRMGEIMNRAAQVVRLGRKISVEDADELASHRGHAFVHGTCFVAVPARAVPVFDLESLLAQFHRVGFTDFRRLVGRVIENLNLQFLLRVIERADGGHELIHHVRLVEDRQLDGDGRQVGELSERFRALSAVLPVAIQNLDFVRSKGGQTNGYKDIAGEPEKCFPPNHRAPGIGGRPINAEYTASSCNPGAPARCRA